MKNVKEFNLTAEENEKLKRLDLYHVIRMEKYLRQGGNVILGNLDAYEQNSEEGDY